MSHILLTGGTGYIATFTLAKLLADGQKVTTTVRHLDSADQVRTNVASLGAPTDGLGFVAADLSDDKGWDAAMAGISHVYHMASPFPIVQPKNPDVLIKPAREGTLRVLRAAAAGGVERVVLTSSTASIMYGHDKSVTHFDEAMWSDGDSDKVTPYARSKTLAEKAAWDFIAASSGKMALVVINPSLVLGPAPAGNLSASLDVIKMLLSGAYPALPRLQFPMVDVRDLADLHIAAMNTPSAVGKRYIGSTQSLWMAEIAQILRAALGAQARKVPKFNLPDMVVKMLALVDPVVASIVGEIGHERVLDNAAARTQLGFAPRPMRETILDAAQSLLSHQIVRV